MLKFNDQVLSSPWEIARDHINFRPGGLSMWTGDTGHGKSLIVGQTILHAIRNGKHVSVINRESTQSAYLNRLIRQSTALEHPSRSAISGFFDKFVYDNSLYLDINDVVKSIDILFLLKNSLVYHNADTFVIDSMVRLDIPLDNPVAQREFVQKLCDFKNEHNVHIHLIVHKSMGLENISDMADNVFEIWRDKEKEKACPDEMMPRYSDCLLHYKNKNSPLTITFPLWFDRKTLQYLEHEGAIPVPFFNY